MAKKAEKKNSPKTAGNSSGLLTGVIIGLAVLLVAAIAVICVMLFGKSDKPSDDGKSSSEPTLQEPVVDAETQAMYDRLVMTVGDYAVDYETYRYFYLSGLDSFADKDAGFFETSEGVQALEELEKAILDEMLYRASVTALCKKYNLALTDEESQQIKDQVTSTAQLIRMNYGVTMTAMLSNYHMTLNYYTESLLYEALADKLYTFLTDKSSTYIDYSSEAVEEYAADFRNVRHILYGYSDGLSEEEAKAKAEQTLQTLQAITNEEERLDKFLELMKEGSNDYDSEGDNFYYYRPGEMDKDFEAAVDELSDGQLSGVVKSQYGYHIILRQPLDMAFFEEKVYPSYKFRELVEAEEEGLSITRTDVFATITPATAK